MIKGILFDKDGTLIDFDKVWVHASESVIRNLLEFYDCDTVLYRKKLQELIGIRGSSTIPDSLLAEKSLLEITEAMLLELGKAKGTELPDRDKALRRVINDYHRFAMEAVNEQTMICDLKELFLELKAAGFFIGIASQDDNSELKKIVGKIGIDRYVSYIGGFGAVFNLKPDSEMAVAFAKTVNIRPDEIAVVGDLKLDMEFAKNSRAIGIGVLSGLSEKAELQDSADYIIDSIADLPELLKKINS